ncbi:YncE family protein [Virgisporangium aurantiacum]|uniref:PQQ-like domain-containing protein n=1 Tax=Virgisporangium aurantiacum TaxID=175570 RepID=A0A8J3Z5A6_9ACTN|nr:PQQ-like beta-propeller repeat protein [Virgisporangium aurantiacum]GIJ55560.1 hypothetical protein Vau01_030760 [Virgisporangium aurantiacum]
MRLVRSILVIASLLAAVPYPAAANAAGPATTSTAARPTTGAACTDPAYQTFGPASITGAIVGATTHNGFAYVVTRGLKPPILAEIDLATRRVVRQVPLPDGPLAGEPEGGWATTVSGGQIYVGTYPVPDLYRFDPATGTVTHIRSFGVNGGFVWSLTTAPDGTIYAGTYPDGKVWEYVPATGAVRNFGVLATGERYVRAVAADATNVYAGLLDKAKLVAINRTTGAVTTLATGTGGFATVGVGNGRVVATSGSTLYDVRPDGTDLRTVGLGELTSDMLLVEPDGTVYLSARPTGAVLRYRTGDPAPTPLGTPKEAEETRRLVVENNRLTGFSGSGGMWTMDPATGATEFTDLIAAGLTPGSERPQAIRLEGPDELWVAGHFSVTVRDLRTMRQRRIWVPGEPKAIVSRGDTMFAAMYPSGEILAIDRTSLTLRSLGYLGHGQQRPWDLEYDPISDKLLVATAPLGASLQGALSIVDPDTGAKQVYVNVIPDQSLMSLSLDVAKRIVYLGGDVRGGGGTPPVRTAASVAAFDLRTRTVRWQVTPVAGYQTFQDLKVQDGLLFGVYKRNASWFRMNLATRTITHSGPLPGYGELHVHNGTVFTATYFGGGNVYALGTTAKLVATGLGDEWYTNPQLAFEPGSWNAWALIGRDLARIRLDPACPTVTI